MNLNKNLIEKLDRLGESHGFRNIMTICSVLWRNKLKRAGFENGAAFVPTSLGNVKGSKVKSIVDKLNQYDKAMDKSERCECVPFEEDAIIELPDGKFCQICQLYTHE